MTKFGKLAVFDETATVTPEAFEAAVSFAARDAAMTGVGFIQGGKRVAPEDVFAPFCKTCNGTEWVCESHPDKPWGDALNAGPNSCHCGGAGKPCPECNPLSKERRDDPLSA